MERWFTQVELQLESCLSRVGNVAKSMWLECGVSSVRHSLPFVLALGRHGRCLMSRTTMTDSTVGNL